MFDLIYVNMYRVCLCVYDVVIVRWWCKKKNKRERKIEHGKEKERNGKRRANELMDWKWWKWWKESKGLCLNIVYLFCKNFHMISYVDKGFLYENKAWFSYVDLWFDVDALELGWVACGRWNRLNVAWDWLGEWFVQFGWLPCLYFLDLRTLFWP